MLKFQLTVTIPQKETAQSSTLLLENRVSQEFTGLRGLGVFSLAVRLTGMKGIAFAKRFTLSTWESALFN